MSRTLVSTCALLCWATRGCVGASWRVDDGDGDGVGVGVGGMRYIKDSLRAGVSVMGFMVSFCGFFGSSLGLWF